MVFKVGNWQWKVPEHHTCLNLFVVGIVLLPIYIKFMDVLSQFVSFPTTITTFLYYGTLWWFLLRGISGIRNQTKNAVLLAILFLFVISIELVLHPSSTEFIIGGSVFEYIVFQPSVMLTALWFSFIGLAVSDFGELGSLLYKGARLGVVGAALTYGLMLIGGIAIHYDDMSTAYGISFGLCILVAFAKSKTDWFCVLLGAVCLVLAGTRGPIVSFLLSIILRLLCSEESMRKKTVGIVILASVGFVLVSNVGAKLMMTLNEFFSAMGVSNLRLLDYMNNDMLFEGSGREDFFRIIVEAIKEHPIVGYGIGGDRSLLDGFYVHNLVLEIFTSLGVIVGSAFLAWLVYLWSRMLLSSNTVICRIGVGLFSGIVVKLFFSLSFFTSREFFLLLGMCIAAGKAKKKTMASGESI